MQNLQEEQVYKQIVENYVEEVVHEVSQQTKEQKEQNDEANNGQNLINANVNVKVYENQPKSQQKQQKTEVIQTKSNKQINQKQFKNYKFQQIDQQDGKNITISITKTEKKGSIVTSYFVYHIVGSDENGSFSVQRRFNEFFEMRACMVQRWPGCFVPSIPAKNALMKNDSEIVIRRKRYLNDFVKKIARLPHLYYSQEFQTLLRSQEPDLSSVFSKSLAITTQSIINKYRISFSELAGKEINYETNQKINHFIFFIKKNQSQLQKDRENMKRLAQSNDKLNQEYSLLFSKVFPIYQSICMAEYSSSEHQMLYLNESQAKLQQHKSIIQQSTSHNPFWQFYDMLRHEQRDGLAFLQAIESKFKYENKRNSLQMKIKENQKIILELSTGRKSTINSKGSNQDLIKKLQNEVEEYKIEKQNLIMLVVIITALIAYIEIERYKEQKREFYLKSIMKIGANEVNKTQILGEIWQELGGSGQGRLSSLLSE